MDDDGDNIQEKLVPLPVPRAVQERGGHNANLFYQVAPSSSSSTEHASDKSASNTETSAATSSSRSRTLSSGPSESTSSTVGHSTSQLSQHPYSPWFVHTSNPITPTSTASKQSKEKNSTSYYQTFQSNSTVNEVDRESSHGDLMSRESSYMNLVEPGQRTINSVGAVSTDTQDSARYEDAPFACGNIQFWSNALGSEEIEPKRHYVSISSDTPTDEIANFMATFWKMRSPKIVLSVISGEKHFKGWKTVRLKEQFQKGIIKAANATEMWIVTSGIDSGVSKMIGEAIAEEKARRASNRTSLSQIRPNQVQKFQKLTLIGVVSKERITYGSYFDGSEGVMIKNEGNKIGGDMYELNPDHTHFLMVEDEDKEKILFTNFRCTIEQQFQYQLGRPRRLKRLFSWGSDEYENENTENPVKKMVPVIGLFVQGSPRGVDHVLFYLTNKMPVVILKGSGGTADLIAYAFEELQERPDPDFKEHFLKQELIKLINKMYPNYFKDNELARNTFRDKILDCVENAQEDDQVLLTIVNMRGWDANLKDLDKYLLKALFNCEKQLKGRWREQLHKDLQLILDWNRPDLAESEIFQREEYGKMKVDKDLFEQALLKQDREEFVEIFLDQGIQVHKYLNHKKFKVLFERADDREFFVSICLERVLGQSIDIDQPLEQNFLATDLNRLILKLSGIKEFVHPYELSMNSVGLYVLNPAVAERKAINCLIIWAVLINRHNLAKILWKRCEEPIALALICSNMYREISKFCTELYLRTEMENNAKEFGEMALVVLDIGNRDSSAQAYNMLSTPMPDFNNKTVIEIAHDANYMNFIAHPCCQKWLTKKLFGAIQVKELDWGFVRLPNWFKIMASVCLIFPMYIWISFLPPASDKKKKAISMKESTVIEDEEEDSDSTSDEDEYIPASKSVLETEIRNISRETGMTGRLKSVLKPRKEKKTPFWRQIYLLYTAPITKFWLTQTFYFAFLGIFCLALLWPTCGNVYLDMMVWLWTSVILTERVRRTYLKHQKSPTISLAAPCAEIVLIILFLILYLFLRIIPHWFHYADIHTAKTVLSVGLLFFFYRLLGIYLPISPTLGPMLVRMNRMIKYDFVAFIRMFLIFLISGGVTIQAILYPNYPLGTDLIKKVLTRPLFAMFLTQIGDLDGDPSCSYYYHNITPSFCTADSPLKGSHMSNPEHLITPIQTCPYSSLFGYLITIQYLLICKLVLVTLLFAMFALTITKVDKEASVIWKFQRYALVKEFEDSLTLPPPLTLFNYLYMLIILIHNKIKGCRKSCKNLCCCKGKGKQSHDEEMSHKVLKIKRSQDYNYWTKCSNEYITKQEYEKNREEMPKKQTEIINTIHEDMRLQKKNMKRMTDRIVELERTIQTSRMYLEDIYHKLDKTDVVGVANTKGQIIHVAARQSPYPGTRLARFPVFDKYVPWEQVYDVYDPKTYTKKKEQFSEDEIIFVDEDLLELILLKQERDLLTEDELKDLPPLPSFTPTWNAVVTVKENGAKRVIDRRSWITVENQPFRYKLDPVGLPMNPMGRTGIRGKGSLWRWGPNHVIKTVCTRWRCKYNTENQPIGYLYVEGKKLLEFIAVVKDGDPDFESVYCLPGGFLHGLTSPYSTLCEAFMRSVFSETDFHSRTFLDQGDMIQLRLQPLHSLLKMQQPYYYPIVFVFVLCFVYFTALLFFAQFATQNTSQKSSFSMASPSQSTSMTLQFVPGTRTASRTSLKTEPDSQGFSASLLYKGYLDDSRNTDNVWVETEVWNFHYDLGDHFDVRIPEDSSVSWKEVSPNVKLFGNEGAIVQEAARIHDAYH